MGERWEVGERGRGGGGEGGREGEEGSLTRSRSCRAWSVWTSPTTTWLRQFCAFILFWVGGGGRDEKLEVGGGRQWGRGGEPNKIRLLQGLTNNGLVTSVLPSSCFGVVGGEVRSWRGRGGAGSEGEEESLARSGCCRASPTTTWLHLSSAFILFWGGGWEVRRWRGRGGGGGGGRQWGRGGEPD